MRRWWVLVLLVFLVACGGVASARTATPAAAVATGIALSVTHPERMSLPKNNPGIGYGWLLLRITVTNNTSRSITVKDGEFRLLSDDIPLSLDKDALTATSSQIKEAAFGDFIGTAVRANSTETRILVFKVSDQTQRYLLLLYDSGEKNVRGRSSDLSAPLVQAFLPPTPTPVLPTSTPSPPTLTPTPPTATPIPPTATPAPPTATRPPPTSTLPTAKADGDLTGDDWVTLTSQGKSALVARLLGRVPYCHFTVAQGVSALDDVYSAPETRSQKVVEVFAAWLALAGCKKP